jgi:hypothetical protein
MRFPYTQQFIEKIRNKIRGSKRLLPNAKAQLRVHVTFSYTSFLGLEAMALGSGWVTL